MKNKVIPMLLLLLGLAMGTQGQSFSPEGIWKTIDDKTGEAKSHVEIYSSSGKLYGKIIKLLQKAPDTICEKCSGEKKDKPVVGMVIIEAMEPYKDYWKKGTILDPETGNEYGCTVWFENANNQELQVRGKHWSGLYRTQTWYRVK